MFLMSRFYRPLQSPLCAFPQNLCRITTTKLLAHLSATYRLLQSRYRLIDADKVFHRYMVAMLQAVTWKTLTSLATALNSIPLWGERSIPCRWNIRRWQRPKEENICETGLPGFGPGMQQSKCCALPLGDSPKLRERDHLLPDYFSWNTLYCLIITPAHGTLKNLVLSNALFHFSFPAHRLHTLLMPWFLCHISNANTTQDIWQ